MARQRSLLHQVLSELRRRHVFRVSAAYAVCAFFTVQITEIILPALLVPEWVQSLLVVLAIIGLPVVAILTWIYDITPEGVVRTDSQPAAALSEAPGKRFNWRWLDFLIIACLLGILAFVLLRDSGEEPELRPGRSIAVLPFADMSPGRDTGYFSDGMSEAIMDSLAQVPELTVIARTSSFAFRDSELDVRQVAENLGVATVLEGSVRRAGDRILVSARLIDGASGRNLWSETYGGVLDDVFRVQDNISRAIVDILQIRLLGDQQLVPASTADNLAYDEYLRGRSRLRGQATLEDAEAAIEHFRHALDRDPEFVLARAGLCTAYWQQYDNTRDARHAERAVATCMQVELLDAGRAETQVALGNVYRGTGQQELAHSAFERALELEPGYSAAHVGLGMLLTDMGQFEAAEQQLRRAIELDPAYWRNYNYLGALYFNQAEYSEAAVQFSRAVQLEPDAPRARSNLGAALWWSGDFETAADQFREVIERNPTASVYNNAGANYFFLREYRHAEDMFRAALALTPLEFRLHAGLADALSMQQDRSDEASAHSEQAIALARERLEINPIDHVTRASLALRLARTGRDAEAKAELDLLLARNENLGWEAHRLIGETQLALGNRRAALEQLARAVQQGYPTTHLAAEPRLEPLYDDPEFRMLVDGNETMTLTGGNEDE